MLGRSSPGGWLRRDALSRKRFFLVFLILREAAQGGLPCVTTSMPSRMHTSTGRNRPSCRQFASRTVVASTCGLRASGVCGTRCGALMAPDGFLPSPAVWDPPTRPQRMPLRRPAGPVLANRNARRVHRLRANSKRAYGARTSVASAQRGQPAADVGPARHPVRVALWPVKRSNCDRQYGVRCRRDAGWPFTLR